MATASSILSAIDTAIQNMMSGGGAQEVDIGGRRVKYFDLDSLIKARAVYAQIDSNSSSSGVPFRLFNTKPKGVNL